MVPKFGCYLDKKKNGHPKSDRFLSKDYKKDIFSILADGVELLRKKYYFTLNNFQISY